LPKQRLQAIFFPEGLVDGWRSQFMRDSVPLA